MPFIETIAPADAQGAVRDMYRRQQEHWGYVPNYAKVFSHRPQVMERWARLLAEIRRPMDDQRFELATFAAAHELKNTACALEHGKQLARYIGDEAVISLAGPGRSGEVSDADAAIAGFARKIARDASSITPEDVGALREHGLSDAEVFDIAAAAAGRAFFTKMLDALGVMADSEAADATEAFKQAMVVGRPISGDGPEYVPTA